MPVSTELLIFLAFIALAAVVGFLRWRERRSGGDRLWPEARFGVELDAERLSLTDPDGSMQGLARADLVEVAIETNDSGPWGADFWWLLAGRDGGVIAVPQGATGEQAMIDWVTALPGFDHEQWIAASRSTRNARFVCWRRG